MIHASQSVSLVSTFHHVMQGVLSVGLFMNDQEFVGYAALNGLKHNVGLFHGGGWYPLGVQALLCVCVIAWSMMCTFVLLNVSVLHIAMGTCG